MLFEEKGGESFVEILLRGRETSGAVSVADARLDDAGLTDSGKELVAGHVTEMIRADPAELRLVLENPFTGEERKQGVADPTQVADGYGVRWIEG